MLKWPEKPTFCGFPTAEQEGNKNVPDWASWRRERSCGRTLSA
jgi:hypothetical protein